MRRFTPSGLTAAQQDLALRLSPITLGSGRVKRGRLSWWFTVQPSAMSRTYALELEYHVWDVPRVFVRTPDLVELASGRRLPHVYSERPTRLCLYLPRSSDWQPRLTLAATIVPWAYLWLYYFEDWLVSGEWRGGGVHLPAAAEKAH